MEPTIKQMATGFKAAMTQLVEAKAQRSRGLDMVMAYILGNVTGIDIERSDMGSLFQYQLVNPITENVLAFQNEGLGLFYKVEGEVYWFTVKYEKHIYSISLPYPKFHYFDLSNTLH